MIIKYIIERILLARCQESVSKWSVFMEQRAVSFRNNSSDFPFFLAISKKASIILCYSFLSYTMILQFVSTFLILLVARSRIGLCANAKEIGQFSGTRSIFIKIWDGWTIGAVFTPSWPGGGFRFTCQRWWSFCCRYVTDGLIG